MTLESEAVASGDVWKPEGRPVRGLADGEGLALDNAPQITSAQFPVEPQ